MDRLLLACLALTIVGLAALAGLGHLVEPSPITLRDAGSHEGERVCVDARVAHVRWTETGSVRFVLVDGDQSLEGTAAEPWTAVPGDVVHACGTLDRWSGTLRLRPERSGDVTILQRWDERAVSLSELAHQPWDRTGQQVVTYGVIVREGTRTFLADSRAGDRILVGGEAIPNAPLRVWGHVEFDADDSQFRLIIDAFEVDA